ncbi:MAG: PDZ domain-containing protein, partial [Candidatus Latescibacteria bacterium]|nr:PDZ domain-containing protein [Candidatus Latescibacterota bacterium]
MKQRRGILIRMIPFALLAVGLAAADCWAVQPYTPVHPDPVLEPWRWTVFPELKGLGLQCIAEDREGRMWFGVADGVRVFDGANWTAYTEDDGVLGRPVQALCTARDGSVYAGTYTGVSRFRDGKWQRVFAAKDDIPLNVLAVIEASDRSIWAATWYGALRIRNEKATLHASADFESLILALAPNARFVVSPDEATTPRPWGGTRGAGIGVLSSTIGYRTRPLVIHTVLTGGPADAAGLRTGDRIMAIDGSSTGSLDIPAGTTATLTVEREGRAGSLEVTVTGKELKETYRDFWVYDAHEDREGLMWFGLRGGPICRYDPRKAGKDDAWRLYTEADGLDLESGSRIHRTGDGTVWAASRSERSGIN